MLLFADVKYHLSPSLSQEIRSKLSIALIDNGATGVSLDEATHIITNSNQFEGSETVEDTAFIVTDQWVTRSITTGKLQQPQFYSPDPSMIFSGVVACSTELPAPDVEVISAGITALGGQWRTTLTRDVTHLFAISPGSQKYETALHFQHITHAKVVLPHWFDDAVRLGMSFLPTSEYEWPEPRLLRVATDAQIDENKKIKMAADKKALFKTALWTPGKDVPFTQVQRDLWQKRRILLSPSLALTTGRREAVAAGIRRANGIVVEYSSEGGDDTEDEEIRKIQEADVLITRYRSGLAYMKAVKAHKTIGTLAWLFHVESTGVISRPLDQLLHYPIPKKAIEGFSAHEITVTNYTGETREYLKKLISIMGAQFTPSMSGRNTVLIAAYLTGNKATKARNWSIPVVNHTWLEDCFVQWRNLTVGLEKYIVFPPGVDFSQMLGERGVGRAVLEDADLGLVGDDEAQEEVETGKQDKPSVGTNTSAKDADEVENVIGLFDSEGDLYTAVDNKEPGLSTLSAKPKSASRVPSKPTSTKSPKGHSSFQEGESAKVPHAMATPRKRLHSPDGSGDAITSTSRRYSGLSRRGAPHVEVPVHSPNDSLGKRRESRKSVVDEENEREPGPSTRKRKIPALSEGENDSETEAHRKPKPKRRVKTKSAGPLLDSDDDTPVRSPKAVIFVPKAKSDDASKKAGRMIVEATPSIRSPVRVSVSPKTVPSVVITSLPTSPPKRTASLRATAFEASVSPKRDRPRAIEPSSSSPARTSGTPPTLSRAPTKRSAATRAIQKLHDEIMPDVLNFQQEMRNKAKSKGKERPHHKNTEDEGVASGKGKGKKRSSDVHGTFNSDVEPRDAKKRKSSRQEDKKNLPATDGEDDDDDRGTPPKSTTRPPDSDRGSAGEEEPRKHGRGRKSNAKPVAETNGASEAGAKPIKLMTTQVNLPDDVLKVLTKLGVRMTTKPSECTHLLAPHLVRTEKFLCALAVAPFILSEDWAIESVARKQLLPEDDYVLRDTENEKKFSFKLADAIRRAKDIGGRLLADHTFYVTPKVPVDMKLLKHIVISGGGQFSTQTPTSRILSSKEHHRHIVSCPADVSIWRPLAHQYPIYSHELLLTGTLKQEVDWDDAAYRVQCSVI